MISKVLIVAGILASSAAAQTVELRMNENPPGPVPINGVSVTKGGETFTFADTTGATYDSANGGQLTYTQDPVIEGNTAGEVITVSYSVPVYTIQFGIALSTRTFPVPNMATVAVFNGATQLASFPCAALASPANSSDAFTNGRCNYFAGAVPVTSMTVTMNSGPAGAFGLGELIVNLSPVTVPAASPATLSCLAILLAGLAVFLQRKQLQSE